MPSIKHSFVSPEADGPDTTLLRPSDWNRALQYTNEVGAPSGTEATVREALTNARQYFVRSDGSDTNNGLTDSPVGAFQTWQKAYNVVRDTLDFAGNIVSIQHGTETGTTFSDTIVININGGWVGGGTLIFDGINSANCTLDGTILEPIRTEGSIPGSLIVRNFKLTSSFSGLVTHAAAGALNFTDGMDWGSAAGFQIISHNGGCPIYINGTNTISGGGLSHFLAAHGGVIFHESTTTTTITGSPAFGVAFAYAINGATVHSQGQAWSGSATGPRYNASSNGIINTAGGGANYFPGDSPGLTGSGGQYL